MRDSADLPGTGFPENGVALNTLISELMKQGVLTALKAKRARAAAGFADLRGPRPV